MPEMQQSNDLHIENDKFFSPYLLAASFQGLLQFKGHYTLNGIVYWLFSPKEKARLLIDQLQTKTDPHIPAQDLFSAIETFWEKISLYKKNHLSGSENRKT